MEFLIQLLIVGAVITAAVATGIWLYVTVSPAIAKANQPKPAAPRSGSLRKETKLNTVQAFANGSVTLGSALDLFGLGNFIVTSVGYMFDRQFKDGPNAKMAPDTVAEWEENYPRTGKNFAFYLLDNVRWLAQVIFKSTKFYLFEAPVDLTPTEAKDLNNFFAEMHGAKFTWAQTVWTIIGYMVVDLECADCNLFTDGTIQNWMVAEDKDGRLLVYVQKVNDPENPQEWYMIGEIADLTTAEYYPAR